jgi:hypothetical protein
LVESAAKEEEQAEIELAKVRAALHSQMSMMDGLAFPSYALFSAEIGGIRAESSVKPIDGVLPSYASSDAIAASLQAAAVNAVGSGDTGNSSEGMLLRGWRHRATPYSQADESAKWCEELAHSFGDDYHLQVVQPRTDPPTPVTPTPPPTPKLWVPDWGEGRRLSDRRTERRRMVPMEDERTAAVKGKPKAANMYLYYDYEAQGWALGQQLGLSSRILMLTSNFDANAAPDEEAKRRAKQYKRLDKHAGVGDNDIGVLPSLPRGWDVVRDMADGCKTTGTKRCGEPVTIECTSWADQPTGAPSTAPTAVPSKAPTVLQTSAPVAYAAADTSSPTAAPSPRPQATLVDTIHGTVRFTGAGTISVSAQQGDGADEVAGKPLLQNLRWMKGADWWVGKDMKDWEAGTDGAFGTMTEEEAMASGLFSKAHQVELAKQQAVSTIRLAHAAVARAFAAALRLPLAIPSEFLSFDLPYQPCFDDPTHVLSKSTEGPAPFFTASASAGPPMSCSSLISAHGCDFPIGKILRERRAHLPLDTQVREICRASCNLCSVAISAVQQQNEAGKKGSGDDGYVFATAKGGFGMGVLGLRARTVWFKGYGGMDVDRSHWVAYGTDIDFVVNVTAAADAAAGLKPQQLASTTSAAAVMKQIASRALAAILGSKGEVGPDGVPIPSRAFVDELRASLKEQGVVQGGDAVKLLGKPTVTYALPPTPTPPSTPTPTLMPTVHTEPETNVETEPGTTRQEGAVIPHTQPAATGGDGASRAHVAVNGGLKVGRAGAGLAMSNSAASGRQGSPAGNGPASSGAARVGDVPLKDVYPALGALLLLLLAVVASAIGPNALSNTATEADHFVAEEGGEKGGTESINSSSNSRYGAVSALDEGCKGLDDEVFDDEGLDDEGSA